MNHLLSMAIVLMTLAPQNQNLPEEFYRLPEQLRERATVVVTGTFGQGRTPCIFRPDGSRVWFIDSWFTVKKVYQGELKSRSIRVNTAMLHAGGDENVASATVTAAGAVLEPEDVADAVIDGLRAERFLILPHPEVGEFFRRRGDDHERWLAGMRRLQRNIAGQT